MSIFGICPLQSWFGNASLQWTFQYSVGMPTAPTLIPGGFTFGFPSLPNSVHYLVKSINRPPVSFSMAGSLDASADAVFDWHIPGGTNVDGGLPPNFRFYFQRSGDNMSAQGDYQYYRWWSNPDCVELKNGSFALNVPMDPSRWSSIYGVFGDAAGSHFTDAISNCEYVGITFGGGGAFGHGITLTSGTAKLTVTQFDV